MLRTFIASLTIAAFALFSSPAMAYTECNYNVAEIYVGDGGSLFVSFTQGGYAGIGLADPSRDLYLSLLLTAKTANKQVRFRFTSNSEVCGTPHGAVTGIWIL